MTRPNSLFSPVFAVHSRCTRTMSGPFLPVSELAVARSVSSNIISGAAFPTHLRCEGVTSPALQSAYKISIGDPWEWGDVMLRKVRMNGRRPPLRLWLVWLLLSKHSHYHRLLHPLNSTKFIPFADGHSCSERDECSFPGSHCHCRGSGGAEKTIRGGKRGTKPGGSELREAVSLAERRRRATRSGSQ